MTAVRPETSSSATANRFVMVGAAVPEDVMNALMKADPVPQVQTYKLSWAIVRGIESTGNVVDLISTVAICDYPKSDWLWSGYRKWDRGNGSDNRLVPFINVLGLKHLTRFLGCLAMLVRWALANRGQKRHVLVYGLISAHLCAVLCVRWLFRMNATALITDLPGLAVSREPWWKRALRPIDRAFIYRAVRSMGGLIVLTRQIAEDFAPGIPALVVEGVLSIESEELAKTTTQAGNRKEEFIVLYAGGLQSDYGIPMLLDTFAGLPGDEFRLWLLGRGEMEDVVRCRAAEDPRIYYPGLVASEVAFRFSQRATVLINPRPSRQSFTPYSFPSKLLEYMAAGRPVISTRLPGIPEEYGSYMVWLDRETPEGLAALLVQLRQQPPGQLDSLGERAREFVLREKNYRRQGRRIVAFMEGIGSRDGRSRKDNSGRSLQPAMVPGASLVSGGGIRSAPSAAKAPSWKDSLLLTAELAARNVYWRMPRLRAWMKRRRARRQPPPQVAGREEVKAYLRSIGVTEGALVMIHTSVTGVNLVGNADYPDRRPDFLASAKYLVDDLLALLGPSGTLVMPTHAAYQGTDEYAAALAQGKPVVYDAARTPCAVGLANELFRRRPGVERSLHPYNTLSACGPLAAELLRDNLNDSKPLAHGIHSGYYRFCQHDGLVVSIGVPLRRCLTLVHVAEEVRDRDWPIKDHFVERSYLIRIDGKEQCWVVRQPRPEYLMFSLCLHKATRDLVGAGILHESTVGGVRVDWARARDVFEFMMARNETKPYPYYCTWLVPKGR